MISYRVQVYSTCKVKLPWVTVPLQCRGQCFLGYEAATRFLSGLWIHSPHRVLGDKTEKMKKKKKDFYINIQPDIRYLLRHLHPPSNSFSVPERVSLSGMFYTNVSLPPLQQSQECPSFCEVRQKCVVKFATIHPE